MSKPTVGAMGQLKRLGHYLKGHMRTRTLFEYQGAVHHLEPYVDTDYAGCRRTRKSTSGGLIRLGGHTIKTWSLAQSIVTLSAGEAEYYGLVRGSSVALGTKDLLGDLGLTVGILVYTDASAAMGSLRDAELAKLGI